MNSFTPIGLESRREIDKSDGAGGWTPKQVTTWDYFFNGKLKQLTTTNAAGANLELHAVGYLDSSGIYNDGYRTKDSFSLKPGNDSSGPCFPSICIATYGYDPRDRPVDRDDGRGFITTYNLDPSGNILSEVRNGQHHRQELHLPGHAALAGDGRGPDLQAPVRRPGPPALHDHSRWLGQRLYVGPDRLPQPAPTTSTTT